MGSVARLWMLVVERGTLDGRPAAGAFRGWMRVVTWLRRCAGQNVQRPIQENPNSRIHLVRAAVQPSQHRERSAHVCRFSKHAALEKNLRVHTEHHCILRAPDFRECRARLRTRIREHRLSGRKMRGRNLLDALRHAHLECVTMFSEQRAAARRGGRQNERRPGLRPGLAEIGWCASPRRHYFFGSAGAGTGALAPGSFGICISW